MSRRAFVTAFAIGSWLLAAACTTHEVVGVEIGAVTMHPSTASLVDGQSLQFTATVTAADGALLPGATVAWATDHPELVSIDTAGMLVALDEGTATVRATFRGVQGTASVAVLPAPVIVLSQDSVAFRAVAGGESPAPAVIQVLNSGAGTIGGLEASVEFYPGQPGGWLAPTLADTEPPTTLTLTPQTSTIPGGTYAATVVVDSDSDDEPTLLPVSLSVAGIEVTESNGSTSVAESGATDSLAVVLETQPASNVVVEVVSGDTTEAAVMPARVTFTPSTWDVPRSVTVTGPDDPILDGDVTTPITVAVVDAISDPSFAPIPDETVFVSTLDDENGGFTVVESDGGTIVAGSGSDDFTVVLDAQPLSDVVINVSLDDTSELIVSPEALTFTPDAWATPQVVVVTGTADKVTSGPREASITLAIDDALSDDGFDPVPDQVVTVLVISGLRVTESDGSTSVTESGGTDSITVVLDAKPASNVVVELVSDDPTEVQVEPTELTFTPSTWNAPKTVTVWGPDDPTLDGDTTTPVTLTIAGAGSATAFPSFPEETVLVSTLDDEIAGFTVAESGDGTIVPEGGSDSFTVVLDAQPLSEVVVDVWSDDPSEVTVLQPTLLFTPDDWATPRVVVVVGVEEEGWDGPRGVRVRLAVDEERSDDGFDDVHEQVVRVLTFG